MYDILFTIYIELNIEIDIYIYIYIYLSCEVYIEVAKYINMKY